MTAHRRENWNGGLGRIAEAIGRLATIHRAVASWWRSIRTRLFAASWARRWPRYPNVIRTEPLAYAQFARLMSGSALIVTDSGGIQEEAPALGVPVLVARESTERGEGVDAGVLRLVGTSPDVDRRAGRDRCSPIRRHTGSIPLPIHTATAGRPTGSWGRSSTWPGSRPRLQRFGPGFSRRVVLAAAGLPGGLISAPAGARDVLPDRTEEHDEWVGR